MLILNYVPLQEDRNIVLYILYRKLFFHLEKVNIYNLCEKMCNPITSSSITKFI